MTRERSLVYYVKAMVPTLYDKQIFLMGIRINVEGFNVHPDNYVDGIHKAVKENIDKLKNADVPEDRISIIMLTLLDEHPLFTQSTAVMDTKNETLQSSTAENRSV